MKKLLTLIFFLSVLVPAGFSAETPQQKVIKAIAEGNVKKVKSLTEKSTQEELANYLFFAAYSCQDKTHSVSYRYSEDATQTDPYAFNETLPPCDKAKSAEIIKYLIDKGAPTRTFIAYKYAILNFDTSDIYLNKDIHSESNKYSAKTFYFFLKENNEDLASELYGKIDGCSKALTQFQSMGFGGSDNIFPYWKSNECYSKKWIFVGNSFNPNRAKAQDVPVTPPQDSFPANMIGASRGDLIRYYGEPVYDNTSTILPPAIEFITFRIVEPIGDKKYYVIDHDYQLVDGVAARIQDKKYKQIVTIENDEDIKDLKSLFFYINSKYRDIK